jgi:hypothetical protein
MRGMLAAASARIRAAIDGIIAVQFLLAAAQNIDEKTA